MDSQTGRTAAADASGPDQRDLPPGDAFRDAFHSAAELREYVSYYVSARVDRLKLAIRRAGILAVLGVAAVLAGGAIVATAAVLLCIGLALAVSAALNAPPWAGYLIVGAGLFALIGAGGWIGWIQLARRSRRKMVEKYELRQTRQRADRGHDVRDAARDRR